MARFRNPDNRDPELEHKKFLKSEANKFEFHNGAPNGLGHYLDKACVVNIEGKIYRGFLVGVSKTPKRYLIYSQEYGLGHYGDGEELRKGSPVMGKFNNHVYCSPADDLVALNSSPNTFFILGENNRATLRRLHSVYIDIVTFEELYKRIGADPNDYDYTDDTDEKARKYLYDLLVHKTEIQKVEKAIRKLEIDDE